MEPGCVSNMTYTTLIKHSKHWTPILFVLKMLLVTQPGYTATKDGHPMCDTQWDGVKEQLSTTKDTQRKSLGLKGFVHNCLTHNTPGAQPTVTTWQNP